MKLRYFKRESREVRKNEEKIWKLGRRGGEGREDRRREEGMTQYHRMVLNNN